jgi:hypothetical protein
MGETQWKMYSPNLICICVDSAKGEEYSGVLWHQYDDRPKAFEGTLDLLQIMEDFYEQWDFPQKSTTIRSFGRKQTREYREKPERKLERSRIEDKKGILGTFVVYVKYRQNSTWQGEAVWVEQGEKQYFESALEMVKLIDNALSGNTI